MSRRAGILEFAVLGLLRESPMHGYELRKRLNTSLGVFRAFSYGTLYPCLKTLVANGWLIEEPGNTPEDALAAPLAGRRAKIVYRLTAEGKEHFEELLSQTGPDAYEDEHFAARFAFFGQTSRDVRMRVLEGRRSRLEERLEKMRASLARTRERLDDYTLELQRHGMESVEREVRWLNELIESERAGRDLKGSASGGPLSRTPHLDRRAACPVPGTPRDGYARRNHHVSAQSGPHSHTQGATGMGSVRVAIVGVGNCAASLVQGVEYYKDADPASKVPGLMHVQFGGYHVGDVEFVAAFDVDAKKVGLDLSDAIGASENNTIKICDVPNKGVTVQRGHTLDGLGKYYRETIEESAETPVDVVKVLKDKQVDVLVCYLPVGSEDAAKFYAQAAIDAKVAFVNALPVFIAGTKEWADKFTEAGVPIVGDDIKSQVGATITHRVMAKLFEDRGVRLERTMQLNVGGNMDFKNMLERDRLESKKISKTQAVTSQIPDRDMGAKNVHIGPSDYVAWLDDRKWAYVRLEGRAFGDVPLNLEYKLEVWDSPNSAGVIIDALRAAKIAKDRGIGGPILSASSYFMKSPPVQYFDDEAYDNVEKFIRGEVER